MKKSVGFSLSVFMVMILMFSLALPGVVRADSSGEIEVEVEIENGVAKVKVEINDVEQRFRLQTADRDEIIAEIVAKTDLTEDEVRANIKFENEDTDDDDDSGRSEVRERSRFRVQDENGEKIEAELEVRVRNDGTIERRFKYKSEDVETEIEIKEENDTSTGETRLKARLSNGRFAEIKVMPDVASERALERLRLRVCSEDNGCEIVLKEVGNGEDEDDDGEEDTEAAYEIRAEKRARVLGVFKAKMEVRARVHAENGEVFDVNKPWWAFLASEEDESSDSAE